MRSKRSPHAAAIIARNGWELSDGALIPEMPKPGRGVVALASRGKESVSVISWHAPNAAGEGPPTKMAGYTAVINAINDALAPLGVTVTRLPASPASIAALLDGGPQ